MEHNGKIVEPWAMEWSEGETIPRRDEIADDAGPTVALSDDLADTICEAVGIDITWASRMILDLQYGQPVKIYLEMFGSDKLLSVDWAKGLQGAEITTVEGNG